MIALRSKEMRKISAISLLLDITKQIITFGTILPTKYNTMISIQEPKSKMLLGFEKLQRMRRSRLMKS